ncbi:hypothetical protein EYF80_048719 [Liparis tanakae]|uniref:Uncharacterized protein n=1 Tax=Liparis tanakae TaxID=230148 RepID=A0A4Z2FIR5_9TELE|nr:hypothetical protein EYF80_048719 [Liparis tanakae]
MEICMFFLSRSALIPHEAPELLRRLCRGVMLSFSALHTSSPSYGPIFRAPLVIDAATQQRSSMLVTQSHKFEKVDFDRNALIGLRLRFSEKTTPFANKAIGGFSEAAPWRRSLASLQRVNKTFREKVRRGAQMGAWSSSICIKKRLIMEQDVD